MSLLLRHAHHARRRAIQSELMLLESLFDNSSRFDSLFRFGAEVDDQFLKGTAFDTETDREEMDSTCDEKMDASDVERKESDEREDESTFRTFSSSTYFSRGADGVVTEHATKRYKDHTGRIKTYTKRSIGNKSVSTLKDSDGNVDRTSLENVETKKMFDDLWGHREGKSTQTIEDAE